MDGSRKWIAAEARSFARKRQQSQVEGIIVFIGIDVARAAERRSRGSDITQPGACQARLLSISGRSAPLTSCAQIFLQRSKRLFGFFSAAQPQAGTPRRRNSPPRFAHAKGELSQATATRNSESFLWR